uniref:Uncharacterized protein n=1 Tax=Cacopsylla melanoneura TaxID=428564 RepID=A0A8D8UDS9_9HEMI
MTGPAVVEPVPAVPVVPVPVVPVVLVPVVVVLVPAVVVLPGVVEPVESEPPVVLATLNEHTLGATQHGAVPLTDAASLEQKSSAGPAVAHSPGVVEAGVPEAGVEEAGVVVEAGVVELEDAEFTAQILALSASDK